MPKVELNWEGIWYDYNEWFNDRSKELREKTRCRSCGYSHTKIPEWEAQQVAIQNIVERQIRNIKKADSKCLFGPPIAPIHEKGWKVWRTFIGRDAPKQVPCKHVWSYLMTHKGKPYAWHTLAIDFSAEIAKHEMPTTWYVIYCRPNQKV